MRSKIIKEHLNDPAFYDKMSALLDEIIAQRKAKALEYEAYLKKIAELVATVESGQPDDTPTELDSTGKRALYNNLKKSLDEGKISDMPLEYKGKEDLALVLAMQIDEAIKHSRPDDWRGVPARENAIKRALYGVLQNKEEVERIFLLIYQHDEY